MPSDHEEHGRRDDEREPDTDTVDEADESVESEDAPTTKPGKGGDRDERNAGG